MKFIELLKKHRIIAVKVILICVILVAIGAVYMTFFFTQRCANFDCFKTNMEKCRNGYTYINDDKQATWRYEIMGKNSGLCEVEVTMLQAKEGELGIGKLAGLTMMCSYPIGVGAYPESSLDKCHGRLKEELQTVVIQKLHTYIIENLGKLAEGLEQV
jgi:hypothetical protein